MLVLSRRIGQALVVPGSQLTVTVLEVQDKSVRLGVSAPKSVSVHRDEVWRRIEMEAANARDGPVTLAADTESRRTA